MCTFIYVRADNTFICQKNIFCLFVKVNSCLFIHLFSCLSNKTVILLILPEYRNHVKNTIFALIVPGLLLNAFNVIMMRTYFTTNIPEEVLEAARIDGGGELYILTKVVLPMSKPIIVTLVLLIGLSYWNDWLNGLYYVNRDNLYSIQVLLKKMMDDIEMIKKASAAGASTMKMPSISIRMAVAVMGALPIMCVYPFFQKYFVKGIVIGAVKG